MQIFVFLLFCVAEKNFSLSCYDRLIITGNLPETSYAHSMTKYLYSKAIPIFDYAKFAEGLRDRIRKQIDSIVLESGKQEDLQPIYSEIIATAIHTVRPDNIATFPGQKLDPRYQGETGNNYHVRIEGTRIKHTMGTVSIKMYDKFSKILRIETTANDISFFKHFREVVHRDGTTSNQMASLKKNIYSLTFLADNLIAANKR